jgi:hypothetical protein
MGPLETVSQLENAASTLLANRRSIKVPEPEDSIAEQLRQVATPTERSQDSPAPKEYAIHVPDVLHRSVGNVVPSARQRGASVQKASRALALMQQKTPSAEERFWLLNRWHGQVLRVGPDSFEAQLFDPANPAVVEQAKFSISELSPDGVSLLRPGAVFYWIIGYRDLGTRQRKRESVIWMRRSGRMDQAKFQRALDHIDEVWGAIDQRKSAAGQR